MNEQRMTLRKDELSLKVLKEPVDEFDTILGIDGMHRMSRGGTRGVRRIEEVFDEIDDTPVAAWVSERTKEVFAHRPTMASAPAGMTATSENKPSMPHPKNPLVVWNMKDLFSLCGPAVTLLLVSQVVSALTFTHLMVSLLDLPHALLDGILLLILFVADGIAFAWFRGRIYTEWCRPLVVLSILTIAPGVVAFVWCGVINLG